ncbi:MAG: putative MFS-type transporter [Firmicutes bacterium]|nr:putative MFS-type transporter [Bacillota bacterium]
MKPLAYIIGMKFKNTVKELTGKPLALILYLLVLLGFISTIVLSFNMPVKSINQGSVDTFNAIVTAVLLATLYLGVDRGIEHSRSFFRMSDANLVFTAPISPKKVLIYGFVNHLFSALVFIFFISFQIPNLKRNFALEPYGLLIIYIMLIIYFATIQLGVIILYSFALQSPVVRGWVKKTLNAAAVLFLIGFLSKLLELKDVLKAAVTYLGSDVFNCIPLVGWFRTALLAAVAGIGLSFWLNISYIFLSWAAMTFVLYKANTDYYEDVLTATENKEELLRARKRGKGQTGYENSKLRKVSQSYRGSGASAIFYRQVLEHRKTGLLFINKNTLFIAVIGIASRYFFPGASMKTVLYFSVYILFFFAIQGKWTQELGKPYIYIIPASSFSKVFCATVSDNLKNAVDGLILFSIAGFMFKSDPLTVVLSAAAYTTFGAIYVYGDLLAQRFLGSAHSRNLKVFLKILLILCVILPGIAISVIISMVFNSIPFIDYYSMLILIVYNMLVSGLIIFLNRRIFDIIEMS